MIRLFISQPMKGKSDEEIDEERAVATTKAIKELGDDVAVIQSYFRGAPHDVMPLYYLGESLKLLATADAAFFAKGWQDARGCRIEHLCAKEYGIRIIEE